MLEHRTQVAFKGKREHKIKVKSPILAYPSHHIHSSREHGSRDYVIVPDIVKQNV